MRHVFFGIPKSTYKRKHAHGASREEATAALTLPQIRHEHNTHAVIRNHNFRLAECAIGARYGVAILVVSDQKRRTQKSEAAHRMQGETSLMQPWRQPDVKHTDRYQEGLH
jgi:hypothetical protein